MTTLNRDTLNTIAIVLLETLEDTGAPEAFVYIPVQSVLGVSLDEFYVAIEAFVDTGLLARSPGPRIVPGPRFQEFKTEYLAHKEKQ